MKPTLDKVFFRVLIDNLGMAYAFSGDLNRAKETFEYGITRDNVYPMFYYNLACTYAEMKDMDGAIAQLRTAFKYKDNQNPGERMPDPARDSSFQRFMTNDRFLAALGEITNASD
jgi:tetratricopeptide (TPR) repeat protein